MSSINKTVGLSAISQLKAQWKRIESDAVSSRGLTVVSIDQGVERVLVAPHESSESSDCNVFHSLIMIRKRGSFIFTVLLVCIARTN